MRLSPGNQTHSVAAPSRIALPLMSWRHPVNTQPDQLTHAVLSGSDTAQCGVVIEDVGAPWPDPEVGAPLSRCSICAHAVEAIWKCDGTQPADR